MKTRFFPFSVVAAGCLAVALCWVARVYADAPNNSTATPSIVMGNPSAPALPYGVSEVVKLYQSGTPKEVIVNYINSSTYPFHLNADGIIYLQKLGIPTDVTMAVLQRDSQLQQTAMQGYNQQQQIAAAQAAAAAQAGQMAGAQAAPQVVVPSSPAPDVTYIGGDYGYPDYSYYGGSYYGGYPYAYWPVGGWGWGWGWNGRGWGWGWGRGRYGGGFRGGFGGGFRGGGFGGGFRGGGFSGGFHGGGFSGGASGGFHASGGGGFGGHGGGGGHR